MDLKNKLHAVFDLGRNGKPLALIPSAIGVPYPPKNSINSVSPDGTRIFTMCIEGPLVHKPDMSGWSYWENYEDIADCFTALIHDDDVDAVVLKINSPGGEVSGLFETIKIMTAAKVSSGKPVVAYIDEDCYSAAYALAMVADDIVVPPTGNVGSIGVITVMAECTEANKKAGIRVEVIKSGDLKADGHPNVELTDDAIARTQAKVDELAVMFFDLVADTRGIPSSKIAGFQAGTFTGDAAVKSGLADIVMSFADCLTLLESSVRDQTVGSNLTHGSKPTSSGVQMSGRLTAKKALDDAKIALAAAKTDTEKATALAAVTSAEVKYKHVKKTVETIESEDEPEPSDDEEEDAEAAPDSESAKALSGSSGLEAMVRKLTGKSSNEEMAGALQALVRAAGDSQRLAAEVAGLRAKDMRNEVAALVQTGIQAGKIAGPKETAWASAQSPKALKAYLEAATPRVTSIEDARIEAKVSGQAAGTVSPEMAKIWTKQGFKAADFPALLAKMNGAKSADGAS